MFPRCRHSVLLFVCLLAGMSVRTDADTRSDTVLAHTRDRQEAMLREQLRAPYPLDGLWHDEDFALAAYWLDERVDEADRRLSAAMADAAADVVSTGDFHWHAYLLERLCFLFGSHGVHAPGRMAPATEHAVLERLWSWAATYCTTALANPQRVWWAWGSENHHVQAWGGYWGAAQLFAKHPDYAKRRYADGTAPADMAGAFDRYFKRWAKERATKGLLVEINSAYNKYTLGPLYNMADFAADHELRRRMQAFLDVYWTEWAIEQVDGLRGGSSHRRYQGRNSLVGNPGSGMAWFHFGLGTPRSRHPGHACAATTFWRPPAIAVRLALDPEARGRYSYVSRRPGRWEQNQEGVDQAFVEDDTSPYGASRALYKIDPVARSLRRVSWCTPGFVLGTSMVEPLPHEAWTAISMQNRWNGCVFAGGDPAARIFVTPDTPERGSVYNSEWGVQHKGAAIWQRLPNGLSKAAHGQRIWFAASLRVTETNGWIIAEAPQAFAVVRVVDGATRWEAHSHTQTRERKGRTDIGQWLVCEDEMSPVIIDVADRSDYAERASFMTRLSTATMTRNGPRLNYRSPFYQTTLTLFTDASRPPLIDGRPVDFTPELVYDSPFLHARYGADAVTITDGREPLILNFERE